jgi:uncharacterized SAM-binding protein YcdF (DUF218 family)
MIYLLSKLLPIPFYPIGLTITLMIAGLVLIRFVGFRPGLYCILAATLVLFVSSSPITEYILARSLESRYTPLQKRPSASAIVLLGGSGVPPLAPREYAETNRFGDRILHAARLYQQGLAPLLIPTGGQPVLGRARTLSEAEINASLLTELMGVDTSAIVLEPKAKNTHDHAPLVANLLRERELPLQVILVTSAIHMHRSVKVFEKAGFTVYPAPTDFLVNERFEWEFRKLVPNAHALASVSDVLHEYYGMIAYRLLRWS